MTKQLLHGWQVLVQGQGFFQLYLLQPEYPASRGPSIFPDKSGRGRDLCQPPRLSHPPKRMSQSGLKPVFPVFAECACALLETVD